MCLGYCGCFRFGSRIAAKRNPISTSTSKQLQVACLDIGTPARLPTNTRFDTTAIQSGNQSFRIRNVNAPRNWPWRRLPAVFRLNGSWQTRSRQRLDQDGNHR